MVKEDINTCTISYRTLKMDGSMRTFTTIDGLLAASCGLGTWILKILYSALVFFGLALACLLEQWFYYLEPFFGQFP